MNNLAKNHRALIAEALNPKQEQAFWTGVRDFPDGDSNFISLKAIFPISKRGEVIRKYEKMAMESGADCAFICHSGNGVLHAHLRTGKYRPSKADKVPGLIRNLTAEAVKNEGNLIVESAPLALKKKIDVWGEARSDSRIMRRIKEEIDPKGILNPGRFVGGI
jgi:glycolate oxidase FAD binding subunit